MSEFKNKSITSKGLELLARALGGEQLTFTKIEMGSGDYEGTVSEATQMVQPQQTLPITNLIRKGGQVTLSAGLKIEDITNSFDWTEIGVYAKGEDDLETLYMYGYTQDSSFVSKDSLNEKLINVTVMVSNATNITATVNNSLVYLTAEALEKHTKDMSTHQDIRDKLSQLGKQLEQLDISWENIEGKPTQFPPSQHDHSMGSIEGLQQALESKAPTHAHPYASNAHTHTKADIGLSNVPNYSATSSVSDSSTSKFATASAVKQAYDRAANSGTKKYVPSNTVRHTLTIPAITSLNNAYWDLEEGRCFERIYMPAGSRIRVKMSACTVRTYMHDATVSRQIYLNSDTNARNITNGTSSSERSALLYSQSVKATAAQQTQSLPAISVDMDVDVFRYSGDSSYANVGSRFVNLLCALTCFGPMTDGSTVSTSFTVKICYDEVVA